MLISTRDVKFNTPGHQWHGTVMYERGVPTVLSFYVWDAGPCEFWHVAMSEDLSRFLGEEVWLSAMSSGNGHGTANIVKEKPVTVLNRILMDSHMDPSLEHLSSRKRWSQVIDARTGQVLPAYAVTSEVYTVSRGGDWIATVQIDATEDFMDLELAKLLKDFFTKKGKKDVRGPLAQPVEAAVSKTAK